MATLHLYDEREPSEVGREVYEALRAGGDVEFRTDRQALVHAFYDACTALGGACETLASETSGSLLSVTDTAEGRQAILAREAMVKALDVVYTLMSVIWESTPAITRAYEEYDTEGNPIPRSPQEILADLGVVSGEDEAPRPYDAFPDDAFPDDE